MENTIYIQPGQVLSITKRGMRYLDNSGSKHFINFDDCYKEIVEIYHHPNIRKFGLTPQYADQYLELLEVLKITKIIGFLSPDGGVLEIIRWLWKAFSTHR